MKSIKYKDKMKLLGGKSLGFGKKKVYFSSSHTLDSWLGGKSEQLIREIRLGKYRVSIWRNL